MAVRRVKTRARVSIVGETDTHAGAHFAATVALSVVRGKAGLTDAVTSPKEWPPVSSMTTTHLTRRFNALRDSADPLCARECDLLKAVARHQVDAFSRLSAPSSDDMQTLVALAYMHDGDIAREVLNATTTAAVKDAVLRPVVVLGVATAARLATDATKTSGSLPARKAMASAVTQAVGTTLATIVKQLKSGLNLRSDVRDAMLDALARLLDTVVDVVPKGDDKDGLPRAWRDDMYATLKSLSGFADDITFSSHVQYAMQAVAHVAYSPAPRLALLCMPSVVFAGGVLKLAAAAAQYDVGGVCEALGELATTVSPPDNTAPKPWYQTVRLLRAMSADTLCEALVSSTTRQPAVVTFFVVEMLDTIARRPLLDVDGEPADHENTPQTRAMQALADVFMGLTAFEVKTHGEDLRAHIMRRLYRLCRVPHAGLQAVAKSALNRVFAFTEPVPAWQRVAKCGSESAVAVGMRLQAVTGVYIGAVDSVTPTQRFYEEFTTGVGGLSGGTVQGSTTLGGALQAVDPVEATVEALRRDAAARNSEVLGVELELYVEAWASASRDAEPDGKLNALVESWLQQASPNVEVLLLHGFSGAGKSLFLLLLESSMWLKYRRGDPTSQIPVLIPLASVKDANGAVEEVFADRAGASVRDLTAGRHGRRPARPWVIVLDGYDEIRGSTNLLRANRIPSLLPGARVIVSSRSEYLEAYGSYRGLFTPGDPIATSAQLNELYICPFQSVQVEAYFAGWEAQHRTAWTADQYVAFIQDTPGLSELASTPFVLRAMADALPLLDTRASRKVYRVDIYAAFLTKWWSLSTSKLAAAGADDLPPDFDAVLSYNNFCMDLAVTMLSSRQLVAESTVGVYVYGGAAASQWARFFADDPVTRTTRQGCPLRPSGRAYAFVHKSLCEFFAALAMWGDVQALVSSETSAPSDSSAINAFPVMQQPAVLGFLVDLFHVTVYDGDAGAQGTVVATLNAIVKASVAKPSLQNAAGNAASLLVQAGVQLVGVDWSHARLQAAVLSDAMLCGANLSGADLRGARLERVMADGGNWESVALEGASLGQYPMLHGHTADVRGVAFSPDGARLASCSHDKCIRVWDTGSWACTAVLEASSWVVAVAFSGDGSRLATAGFDNKVTLWEAATGAHVAALTGHTATVNAVCFSPSAPTRLLSAGGDGLRLWDTETAECVDTLGHHAGATLGVAYSPDGLTVASCGVDTTVRVWTRDNPSPAILLGHTAAVNAVCFSDDGLQVASGSNDHAVRLWSLASGACVLVLEGHPAPVTSVRFSLGGAALASGSTDQTVNMWDPTSGALTTTFSGHRRGVLCVDFSPDGAKLASCSADRTIRVFDAAAGGSLASLEGHQQPATSVSPSACGRWFATGSWDGCVRVWNTAGGTAVATLGPDGGSAVRAVAFSRAGGSTQALAAACGTDVIVWQAASWEVRHRLGAHTDTVRCVAWSPTDTMLLTGGDDSRVCVWDAATWSCLRTLTEHDDWVRCVAWSADGATAASGGDDMRVLVWDTASWGHTLLEAPDDDEDSEGSADSEPDGSVDGDASPTGVSPPANSHDASVLCLGFSPDGLTLVSGSLDRTAAVWVLATGERSRLLPHRGAVLDVEVSGDGALLATAAGDCSAWLWHASSGDQAAQLQGHAKEVTGVCFIDNGTAVVTTSFDTAVRVWGRNAGDDTAWSTVKHLSLSRPLSFLGTRAAAARGSKATKTVLRQHGAVLEPAAGGGEEEGDGGGEAPFGQEAVGIDAQVAGLSAQVAAVAANVQTLCNLMAGEGKG